MVCRCDRVRDRRDGGFQAAQTRRAAAESQAQERRLRNIAVTELLAWLSLAILLLIIGVFVFAYIRHGVKIKPDRNRKNDDWPSITQGGNG
jgi:hypothetical protein